MPPSVISHIVRVVCVIAILLLVCLPTRNANPIALLLPLDQAIEVLVSIMIRQVPKYIRLIVCKATLIVLQSVLVTLRITEVIVL